MQITNKTAARVPKFLAESIKFSSRNTLTAKAFFLVLAKQQKERGDCVQFTWSELDEFFSNRDGAGVAIPGHAYERYKEALHNLLITTVEFETEEVWNGHAIFSDIVYGKRAGGVTVYFHENFLKLYKRLGDDIYSLVYLQEVKRMEDWRPLWLLLWCYRFVNLHSPVFRRLTLAELKEGLELTAKAYQQWSAVADKLRVYVRAVNEKTSIHLKLRPIKEGRQVTAVQFDISVRRQHRLSK